MGKKCFNPKLIELIMMREALVIIKRQGLAIGMPADIFQFGTYKVSIFCRQFPQPCSSGAAIQYHQQARLTIQPQYNVSFQVPFLASQVSFPGPLIDKYPADDVASPISSKAPFSLAAGMHQVFEKSLVRSVSPLLREFHPPDPLVDPFCADKASKVFLSPVTDNFRGLAIPKHTSHKNLQFSGENHLLRL
jgi:hypothetical protein